MDNKSNNLDQLITKLVASQSQDEKLAVYQQWSTTYDDDLLKRGYIAPAPSTQPITLSSKATLSPLPLHERVSILLHAYLKSLSDRSHPVVSLSSPPELQSIFSAAGIPCPLPSNAQPHTDDILMEAVKIILQKSVRTGHPQFYNQLFGRVNLISLAGDWISTATNTNGHTFEAAPVATLLEAEVLLKFANVIGGNYVEQGHDGLLVC